MVLVPENLLCLPLSLLNQTHRLATMLPTTFSLLCFAGLPLLASALDNGFTRPPMGWSALYGAPFGAVNETIVMEAAAGLKASGLLAAGYEYVTLDDWYADRDASGTIVADSTTFPSGMAAVSAKVHSEGCLFGVYSAAGMRTCANLSASLYNEARDAATFANDWKIDYLKYDAVRSAPAPFPPVIHDALSLCVTACAPY